MEQIKTKDNLPPAVKAFCKELTGVLSGQKETEFWEASSIDEFEKNASDIGYEIVPSLDIEHNRAYLVGFSVEESEILTFNNQYMQMKMYFIEITPQEFKDWNDKIKFHRELQQRDYFERKDKKPKKELL